MVLHATLDCDLPRFTSASIGWITRIDLSEPRPRNRARPDRVPPPAGICELGDQCGGLRAACPRHRPAFPHIEQLRHDHPVPPHQRLGLLALPRPRRHRILPVLRRHPPVKQEPEPSGIWLSLMVTGLALRRPLGQDVPAVARGSPAPSRLSRHSSNYFLLLTRCTRPARTGGEVLGPGDGDVPEVRRPSLPRPPGSSRTSVASSAVLPAEPYSFLPTPQ
jgi:hypothetical protein